MLELLIHLGNIHTTCFETIDHSGTFSKSLKLSRTFTKLFEHSRNPMQKILELLRTFFSFWRYGNLGNILEKSLQYCRKCYILENYEIF